ncbi:Hypothetical predicted protein [Olea europaea subsp. europaea]|uniref:Uncharacterized protein n=1 Tax=Olea europaea subsp. europaea TaxID=158383 RepID=A0A8S0VNJ8_OLEEU|nr:Hypothetical predicted protein [Olea europaea subsp. europaea]
MQNQFNMNMLGNGPNVSSLLHQSFGNGGPSSGNQRVLIDNVAETDPLSSVSNGMGFNQSSSSCMSSSITMNPNSSAVFCSREPPTKTTAAIANNASWIRRCWNR